VERLAGEHHVRHVLGRLVFGDAEAEGREVEAFEQGFALAQDDRREGQVQLVD